MTRPHYTRFTTRDNAGVDQCYSVNQTALVGPFARVLTSVTRCVGSKRFKRGDLVPMVVTGRRGWSRRRGGVASHLGYNGAISLKKDGAPLATRVYGVAYLESRPAGYTRLAVLSRALL